MCKRCSLFTVFASIMFSSSIMPMMPSLIKGPLQSLVHTRKFAADAYLKGYLYVLAENQDKKISDKDKGIAIQKELGSIKEEIDKQAREKYEQDKMVRETLQKQIVAARRNIK